LRLIEAFCAERIVVALRRRSLWHSLLRPFSLLGPRDPRKWQPVTMRPKRWLFGLISSETLVPELITPRNARSRRTASVASWLGTHSTGGTSFWPS
jgi:hypothetical protein